MVTNPSSGLEGMDGLGSTHGVGLRSSVVHPSSIGFQCFAEAFNASRTWSAVGRSAIASFQQDVVNFHSSSV